MWRSLVLVTAAGCSSTLEMTSLRIEPAAIDLDVDLAQPAPGVTLRVFDGTSDVTAVASFSLDGAPLGTLAGGQLTSDGRTGGVATLTATVGASTATATVTANVHGKRLVAGAPAQAPDWFALSSDVAVAEPLDPGDGAVLPANLGTLEIDYGAIDSDDIHEIAITAPHLDLRVYAPGAPGPRHVALTADEWTAIARTAVGDGIDLDVRGMPGGGTVSHAVTAHVGIADLDVSTLMFSGSQVNPDGSAVGVPQLYRYDPQTAKVDLFAAGPSGGCLGCHITISADGTRISAAGTATSTGSLVGVLVDVKTGAVTPTTQVWSTSAFDPSGALVTSYQTDGTLILRDGSTAAPIKTLDLGEYGATPAIAPDGSKLAYVVNDPTTMSGIGTTLHVRPWNAATGTVGPTAELATATGIMSPQFSPDGAWITYSRTSGPLSATTQGIEMVRSDGSAPPIELPTAAGDGIPRFVSPIAPARVDGRDPERMVWIGISSKRPIGAQPLVGREDSLWLLAFYPDRGVAAHPIHLPGQSLAISSWHAPAGLP